MRYYRILWKSKRLLRKNKRLVFSIFCGFIYCFVFVKLVRSQLYGKDWLISDAGRKTRTTNTTQNVHLKQERNDTVITNDNVLPVLDPFNPFILQMFSRDLGEMSCGGKIYGKLRKGRLHLPAGYFQEISYTAVGEKYSRKVYVVGESAGMSGISLGFQGIMQHISGKCVHPDKGIIREHLRLVFYKGCEGSHRLTFVFDQHGTWRDSSRRYCVHPRGGTLDPPNRTPLEFSTSCGKAAAFRPLSNGAIQHVASGLCVHPEYGTRSPQDDEKLVLYHGCHFTKLKFVWREARNAENVLKFPSKHIITEEIIKLEVLSRSTEGVRKEYHIQVVEKLDVETRHSTVSNGDQYNVLLLMFHSMSLANFQRKLPRLLEFLKEDLHSINFPGFSLLGEGAWSQTEGILAGLRPAGMMGNETREPRWLFKMFQDAGYVTMVTQDQLDSQELKRMMEKFGASAVDHYPEALWDEVHRSGNTGGTNLCLGSQFSFNLSLSYLKSFLESYEDRPKFSFAMSPAVSSWNMNTANYAEKPLLQLMRRKRTWLKKTMVVVYGNHGWKGNGLRDTTQGKLEERLPFLSIAMPADFREKYKEKFQNMVFNSKLLVTSLDVHATLVDFLKMIRSEKNSTNERNITQSEKWRRERDSLEEDNAKGKGQSLLTKLNPNSRNCKNLGIPQHWCPTVSLREVKVSDRNLKAITDAILDNLNYILKKAPAATCEKLYLKKVISVKIFDISDKVLKYKTSESVKNCPYCRPIFSQERPRFKDFIYQVDVSVEPGHRVYRSKMNLIGDDLYIEVKPRLIRGKPGSCVKVKDSFIANYCVCS